MKVGVGSTNLVKVRAVECVLRNYDRFAGATVIPIEAVSGVSEQPKTLDEIMRGAHNRALAALEGNDLGIGLESGIIEVPYTVNRYMDICGCIIRTSDQHYAGLSRGFEIPWRAVDLVLKKGYDLNRAFFELGVTADPQIGSDVGIIGLFTKNRVTRQDYTEDAIIMAIIGIENSEIYSTSQQ